MSNQDKKKKLAMITMLFAMVVVVVAVNHKQVVAIRSSVDNESSIGGSHDGGGGVLGGVFGGSMVHTTSKVIELICQKTDYPQVCVETLKKGASAGQVNNPKELIKIGFNATLTHLHESLKKSGTLLELEKEPRAKLALENCQELMNYAIDDINISFDQLGPLDISKMGEAVEDFKVWLSAALTYEDTCLNGFDNSTSKAGESMKEALKVAMELTYNGLCMVSKISSILNAFHIPFLNRRLMSEEKESESASPSWATVGQRKLLQATPGTINPNVVVALDGSGKYKSIKEALQEVPEKNKEPFVIYVKEGVYTEWINVTKLMTNVMLIGDGPTKTKITNDKGFTDGINTFATATFST